MKNILADACRSVVDVVALERLPLVFDFDGTLAPLVDDPDAARIPESTRGVLRLVALLHPCAVVSGRSRADLTPRLDGIPLVAIVGNHGAEPGRGPLDRADRALVAEWVEATRSRLAGVAGVEVEDKGLSVALHYRRALRPEAAAAAVMAAAEGLRGARLVRGHSVVNVVPPRLHDKGAAIGDVLSRIGRARAVYVGDDATDEDAFQSKAVRVSVRVGESAVSRAEYFVPEQRDVDELLRALVRARRRIDGLGEDFDGLERALR